MQGDRGPECVETLLIQHYVLYLQTLLVTFEPCGHLIERGKRSARDFSTEEEVIVAIRCRDKGS